MPNRDKTGPEGKGPKTGRGAGPCGAGRTRKGCGIGRGMGFGYRRGLRGGGTRKS